MNVVRRSIARLLTRIARRLDAPGNNLITVTIHAGEGSGELPEARYGVDLQCNGVEVLTQYPEGYEETYTLERDRDGWRKGDRFRFTVEGGVCTWRKL